MDRSTFEQNFRLASKARSFRPVGPYRANTKNLIFIGRIGPAGRQDSADNVRPYRQQATHRKYRARFQDAVRDWHLPRVKALGLFLFRHFMAIRDVHPTESLNSVSWITPLTPPDPNAEVLRETRPGTGTL